MQVAEYIDYVEAEGDRFATAAALGDLDATIASCDGWDMRALVRHLGLIHLWAAGTVRFTDDDWLDADDIPDMARYWPDLGAEWPEDADLIDWYRATHANLVSVLAEAPVDHRCFSFLPAATPVTMWSRRQASEIAVHRFDAEHARGLDSSFEAAFAGDMLDELLTGFVGRMGEDVPTSGEVMHVHATDVDEHWFLTLGGESMGTARVGGDAALTMSGSAADLYLLMWNRTDGSEVSFAGASDLLATWRESCRVRWSGGE